MTGIYLLRHGQTDWSASGKHTGRTDVPLNRDGEHRARAAGPLLATTCPSPALVLCSPALRARQTAQGAGLDATNLDPDLWEWDYGEFEGRTTAQIREDSGNPHWLVWESRIGPGATPGEQPEDVGHRAQRVIQACKPTLDAGGDVVLVAHGHLLRILAAAWLGLPARDGRLLALDPGSVSCLGFERTQQVIRFWNAIP